MDGHTKHGQTNRELTDKRNATVNTQLNRQYSTLLSGAFVCAPTSTFSSSTSFFVVLLPPDRVRFMMEQCVAKTKQMM